MKIKYLLALVLFGSCKESVEPLTQDMRPLWEKNFEVGETLIIYPVIMKNKVIYSSFTEENGEIIKKSKLIALDKESGVTKWEWLNVYSNKEDYLSGLDNTFIINDMLYFNTGPRLYSVNTTDGSTFWFNTMGDYSHGTIHFSGEVLSVNTGYDIDDYATLKEVDPQTGMTSDLLQIYNGDGNTNMGSSFIIDNDYIFYWQSFETDPSLQNNHYTFLFNKYNRKAGDLVFSLNADSLGIKDNIEFMKVYDDESFMFIANKTIGKISKLTGEIHWLFDTEINTFQYNLEIGPSGELYYINQKKLICIDGEIGKPIWIRDYDFTYANSRLIYFGGYLYVICGSRFNIFSAQDGGLISSVYPPISAHSNESDKFQPIISIDKENERVYTASYTTAYCYPTLNAEDL